MDTIIFGNGNLGRAIAAALVARGDEMPTVLGRPESGGHQSTALPEADVAIEASRAEAVYANLAVAIDAGCRRFVIATTAWETDAEAVAALLARHRAAAVAASNLSVGVVLFGRLVERAVDLFGSFEDVDPYLLEWHRRSKADRPSGTARDLARRVLAAHPRKRRLADPQSAGAPAPDELELAVIRAGASPGMHLVGFDAPGETVELRLTARDRSAYAAGALLAADWLMRRPREPGIHSFDEVVDARLAGLGVSGLARQPALVAS
jgi:4-hydroxy-tetrahydrodipicolinate reductase